MTEKASARTQTSNINSVSSIPCLAKTRNTFVNPCNSDIIFTVTNLSTADRYIYVAKSRKLMSFTFHFLVINQKFQLFNQIKHIRKGQDFVLHYEFPFHFI